MLLAIPEYKVVLPGGERPSQTDILILAKSTRGLVVIAVDGKVDEPFGPTLAEKLIENSAGFGVRLDYLLKTRELQISIPESIRYQLIYRTVSTLISAEDFCSTSSIMLVHSFSPTNKWFEDFQAFAALFNVNIRVCYGVRS